MSSENKTPTKALLEGIVWPLVVALICGLAAIGLHIARLKVKPKLFRDLIYWRSDISSAVMRDCAITAFVVVNESGFETDGDVDFSFKLYKESDVKIILHKDQITSTQDGNDLEVSQERQHAKMKQIYLGSPDEKTIFTLRPELQSNERGLQTVIAKRPERLATNEATCIAIVLWNFPPKYDLREQQLYVDNRKCKSYLEFVAYKNRLKQLKEVFYFIFWAVLFTCIFALGIVVAKCHERGKSRKRRLEEKSVEALMEELDS